MATRVSWRVLWILVWWAVCHRPWDWCSRATTTAMGCQTLQWDLSCWRSVVGQTAFPSQATRYTDWCCKDLSTFWYLASFCPFVCNRRKLQSVLLVTRLWPSVFTLILNHFTSLPSIKHAFSCEENLAQVSTQVCSQLPIIYYFLSCLFTYNTAQCGQVCIKSSEYCSGGFVKKSTAYPPASRLSMQQALLRRRFRSIANNSSHKEHLLKRRRYKRQQADGQAKEFTVRKARKLLKNAIATVSMCVHFKGEPAPHLIWETTEMLMLCNYVCNEAL